MARRLLAIIFLGLALGASGCSKKVGDSCAPNERACVGKTSVLFCADGKLADMACRGPTGCSGSKAEPFCDNKVAEEKDSCDPLTSNLACTMDKKSELRCRANKFVLASTCRGPGGCSFEGTDLKCDTDIADPKDPCEDDNGLACALDGKSILKCKKDTYALESSCRGPSGCKIAGGKARCDDRQADVGDVCKTEGNFACAFDGKSLLACRDQKFRLDRACKRSCTFSEAGDKTSFDCK